MLVLPDAEAHLLATATLQKTSKSHCLSGLCHISNTLHMCTTLQQHYGTSLLYEQGYTAELLGKTISQLRLGCSSVDKIYADIGAGILGMLAWLTVLVAAWLQHC